METNKPASSSHSIKILKWTLATAIVIVVNLFFYYVIATVYHEPKFESFCPMQSATYSDAVSCVDAGGQWTNIQLTPAQVTDTIKSGQPLGWCDANFTCNNTFNSAHSIYNRNVFIILITLSVIILSLGFFLPIEVLSLGFSWSGIVSLIIASGRYWSDADNWMKVIILGFALGLLIWIAVRKFRE